MAASDDVGIEGVETGSTGTAASGGEGGPATEPRLPNLAVRIYQLFVSPGKLFDALRSQPRWLGALLLVVVLSLVTSLLIPSGIITESIRQQMLRSRPDAPAEAIQKGLAVARIFRYAGPIIFMPLVIVVVSAVFFLIYEMGMGGDAGFRSVLSATSHTFLIPTIGGLVTLPVVIKARDLQASLTLDLLAPGLDHAGYAYRFLHGMGIFGVWAAVVLGVALSRIYPKRSAGSCISLVLGLYVVLKAVSAIFAR
ncbi:MAG: YIP1 family protein [Candidatus Palauibacterales bacterium]|nr:YIP1 family protein [Candidatus Palauibacterales bacterium]MDP2530162.1 YIP1 family protein [Candidatus Palauibacterales bacterium]MDP2582527.1 YIP1 family protein [Candidatus Palauibacterales bacterium]